MGSKELTSTYQHWCVPSHTHTHTHMHMIAGQCVLTRQFATLILLPDCRLHTVTWDSAGDTVSATLSVELSAPLSETVGGYGFLLCPMGAVL